MTGGRRKALVMGATGFVGSHVTRQLVRRGDDLRVYLRKSSSTVAIDDLDVERCYGDLHDEEALRAAMSDRDVVFYCVVDTRFFLRDPSPLFETNVESLRWVLEVAAQADLFRFVFCSTIGTIAIAEGNEPVTEEMPFNWPGIGGAYIGSRRRAEDMVLRYARDRGLPAVAMCVSNPYGPLDWQPNQGLMVKMAALGKMPVHVKGVSTEVVGIEDVVEAFLLAGRRQTAAAGCTPRGALRPRVDSGCGGPTATARLPDEPHRDTAPAHHVAGRSRQGDAGARMEASSNRRVDTPGRTVLRRAELGSSREKPDHALSHQCFRQVDRIVAAAVPGAPYS